MLKYGKTQNQSPVTIEQSHSYCRFNSYIKKLHSWIHSEKLQQRKSLNYQITNQSDWTDFRSLSLLNYQKQSCIGTYCCSKPRLRKSFTKQNYQSHEFLRAISRIHSEWQWLPNKQVFSQLSKICPNQNPTAE